MFQICECTIAMIRDFSLHEPLIAARHMAAMVDDVSNWRFKCGIDPPGILTITRSSSLVPMGLFRFEHVGFLLGNTCNTGFITKGSGRLAHVRPKKLPTHSIPVHIVQYISVSWARCYLLRVCTHSVILHPSMVRRRPMSVLPSIRRKRPSKSLVN